MVKSVLVYEENFDEFLQQLQKAIDVMKLKIKDRDKNKSQKKIIIKRKKEED